MRIFFEFTQQIDAQEFYANEEIRLTALVEEEKKVALSKTLGIAFVTLGIHFNILPTFSQNKNK